MSDSWNSRVEARTLATAENHREVWTNADLEFVAAFRDEATDEELAVTLGRSYYAIASIKRVLDERMGRVVENRVTAQDRVRSARTYTFIDGDVPPDW